MRHYRPIQVRWKTFGRTLFCGKFIQNSIYCQFCQNQPIFTEDMTKKHSAYFLLGHGIGIFRKNDFQV